MSVGKSYTFKEENLPLAIQVLGWDEYDLLLLQQYIASVLEDRLLQRKYSATTMRHGTRTVRRLLHRYNTPDDRETSEILKSTEDAISSILDSEVADGSTSI